MKRYSKYILAILSILLFVGFVYYLIFYIKPEGIVELFGVENSYLLLFITAIFGGFSTFNLVPFHPLLITLALGGLDPFTLGLLAALGVSLGDSTSYFIGRQGRKILPERADRWFERVKILGETHPNKFVIFSFLYSSLIPFSNDFITIPAGLTRLPFWRVMIPIFLGNVIFDTALAFLAPDGYDLLQRFF